MQRHTDSWRIRPEFWLTLMLKAVLICLLVIGAFSGLQQFEGKAFLWRLITYPIAALVVPIAWAVTGKRASYPYVVDILLTLPFLIDTVGNALDLYGTIWWWDDANHLVNWTLLSGAIGALAWRNNTGLGELLPIRSVSVPQQPSCGRSQSTSPSFATRLSLKRHTQTRWVISLLDLQDQPSLV